MSTMFSLVFLSMLTLGSLPVSASSTALMADCHAVSPDTWQVDDKDAFEGSDNVSVTVDVANSGTFAYLLSQQVSDASTVTHLTVSGNLNDRDLTQILTSMLNVEVIDLSQASFSEIPTKSSSIVLAELEEVKLPECCEIIGGYVFKNFKKLKRINLSHVTTLGNQTFYGCTNLEEINIPLVTTLGDQAFNGCTNLKAINIPLVTALGDQAFYGCTNLKDINTPLVTTLGYSTFCNCLGLEVLDMPKLTSVGRSTFSGCTNLKEINFPLVTSIDRAAFQFCESLEKVHLPLVETIGDGAFSYCYSLQNVELPLVKSLGSAFSSCRSLMNVRIPNVTTVGNNAFDGCKSLGGVVLGDQVESIGSYAFRGTSIFGMSLPETTMYIGDRALSDSMKVLTCRALNPPLIGGSLGVDPDRMRIDVPSVSFRKYLRADGWSNYHGMLALTDPLTKLVICDSVGLLRADEVMPDCDILLTAVNMKNFSNSAVSRIGCLTYAGTDTLSARRFTFNHDFTQATTYSFFHNSPALLTDGPMRADEVNVSFELPNYYSYSSYGNLHYCFFTFPFDVRVSDIYASNESLISVRKYSGKKRAETKGTAWVNQTPDSIIHAYEGISFVNELKGKFVFPALDNANKNNIFMWQDVTIPLYDYPSDFANNRSWNFIGNPYPCYFDSRMMDLGSPFIVWDDENVYNGGKYVTYSPIDDDYVLKPNEAFFIQCPFGLNSVTFLNGGRQNNDTPKVRDAEAPARSGLKSDSRSLFDIVLSDGVKDDRTRLVINEDAVCDYELGRDAVKMIGEGNRCPLVYTVGDQTLYSINERPVGSQPVQLGLFIPEEGDYTLRLQRGNVSRLRLKDLKTGQTVALCEGYSFHAEEGTDDRRFLLVVDEPTAVEAPDITPAIVIGREGQVSADVAFSVYTLDGRVLATMAAGGSVTLPRGFYVISSGNVKHKIIVK